jgi:SAM-dependent methyltransferase
MSDFYSRQNCRLCDSKDIGVVLPLQNSPLCDAYLKLPKKQEFYNLNLCLCNKCGFVQIDTVVNPETIYRDYIYVTTSSPGLQNHFKEYALEVCSFLKLDDLNLTVDIGSNDGTLLGFFKQQGHKVLGIEPSIKAANSANENGIETLSEFFDIGLANAIVDKYCKASLITINNLFANVDNLNEFVESINLLLDSNGVLVIESSYLLDMVDNMVFDFIYHEHLSYFSILPLIRFFKQFDMQLIHVNEVGTKGGSLRYYWARNNSKWSPSLNVKELSLREANAGINTGKFKDYEDRIETVKFQLLEFLEKHKEDKIVGYGASATSTTLLSHFGLHKYLSYLVDDNPDKVNTYSPGYHIPVYNFDRLKNEQPDIIFILAWRFKEEILKKLSFFKGIIIVPLPTFEEFKL